MWTRTGYTNVKHNSEGIKHEKSEYHLNSSVKFTVFGTTNVLSQLHTGHKASIACHNQEVDIDKNRSIF